MAEVVRSLSSKQVCQLLHNKFIVVLGDSVQRSLYKDLVLHLQRDNLLAVAQLKNKGELSFEQDRLVEGGKLRPMHNGTEYQEVRQYHTNHHLVRFYFVTRIYSGYMQSVLDDFRRGLKPDVVIVNSCLWDISRYHYKWVEDYKENLNKFFMELREILPQETLTVWNLTMPVGNSIRGGFLVPEVEQKGPQLREDVIEANIYSGTLANAYGMDVLDLHFHFRFSLDLRSNDGVHWNAIAHRRITSLLLRHIAEAWGVIMPCTLTDQDQPPLKNKPPRMVPRESSGDMDHVSTNRHQQVKNGPDSRPPHWSEPYRDYHHENVMRRRYTRCHYAPYTHSPRRRHYDRHHHHHYH